MYSVLIFETSLNDSFSLSLIYVYNLGVSSSYAMAQNDYANMAQYKSMIVQVANTLCADAAYIAGLCCFFTVYLWS